MHGTGPHPGHRRHGLLGLGRVRTAAKNHDPASCDGPSHPRTARSPRPVPRLYITMDGTGVPTVPSENQGRRGKAPDGRTHTREVKVGCVFTQTKTDDEGRPIRDPQSSTSACSVEKAERFGWLLYAEALRRGVENAGQVIAIGDGAPWIWNLTEELFPRATQIVDIFHARQHLHDLVTRVLEEGGIEDDQAWRAARHKELDDGDIDHLLLTVLDIPSGSHEDVRKALSYFDTNRARMAYGPSPPVVCSSVPESSRPDAKAWREG